MADSPILPGSHAWRDGSGKPLPPEFFRFLRDLTTYVRRTQGDSLELGQLEARVDALESASSGSLNGLQSVEVVGAGSNEVLLQLRGDEASPNPLHYYGADDAGAKGFHELAMSALADVDLLGLTIGDTLVWDGADFVPGTGSSEQLFQRMDAGGDFRITADGNLRVTD